MTRRGFTMVELVGVIGMIAILAAILFPVFAKAREAARTQSCRTNLFNIGMALRVYATEHGGRYPPKDDDLSPLLGKYLLQQQVFVCPSAWNSDVPMGAPADKSLPLGDTGGAPGGMPLGAPGGVPGGAPGGMPGSGPPPRPGAWQTTPDGTPLRFVQAGPNRPPGLGPVTTSFYYRAGRKHNQLPRAPLVTDQEPRHNDDRANVLFSDGAIETLRAAQWRALGFRPLTEIAAERAPKTPSRPGWPPMKGKGGEE